MGKTGPVKRIMLLVLGLVLAGCASGGSTAAPVTPAPCDPGPPGTRQVQVGDRSFLLHVPRDFVNPSPAVFTFHGRGSNAQQQLLLTGFDQVAEEGRFLLVAPEAIDGRWDFRPNGRDAEYLRAVGAAVPCTDPQRVYASGMSMGSAMTFALACAQDRKFAAFGGVALTLYRPRCDQTPPAPIIYFHGTKDPIVPFEGGQPQGEPVTLPAVPAAMRKWAAHNGCTQQSQGAHRQGRALRAVDGLRGGCRCRLLPGARWRSHMAGHHALDRRRDRGVIGQDHADGQRVPIDVAVLRGLHAGLVGRARLLRCYRSRSRDVVLLAVSGRQTSNNTTRGPRPLQQRRKPDLDQDPGQACGFFGPNADAKLSSAPVNSAGTTHTLFDSPLAISGRACRYW